MPAEVASYSTLRWDFNETYTRLEKLIDSFQGAGATANLVNAPASDFLGVDLASEVLPAPEGRVTYINSFERPATVAGAATLLAIQLKDADAFQPTLDKLLKKFEANLEKKSYGGVTYYEVKASLNPGQPDQHACSGSDGRLCHALPIGSASYTMRSSPAAIPPGRWLPRWITS